MESPTAFFNMGTSLLFHPEQETEKAQSFYTKFIDQHDGNKGYGAENKILHENNGVPVNEKISPYHDDTLVKDIKRQNGCVGIFQQPVSVSEMPAPDSQDGKNPNPGIESPEKRHPKIIEAHEGRRKSRSSEPIPDQSRNRSQGQKNHPLFLYSPLVSFIRCEQISIKKIKQVDKNIPTTKIALPESIGMKKKFHERQGKHPQQNSPGFFEKGGKPLDQKARSFPLENLQ
jgi:hypothetical protein